MTTIIMDSDLNQIVDCLKRQRGIDFCGYRSSTLRRRLLMRMAQAGELSCAAYLKRLIADPSEPDRLIDMFGVNVSHFFRDPLVFEMIAQRLLPELIEAKIAAARRELRVWSAGCGGGEEAYSLAMLLHQALKKQQPSWLTYIFASDINFQSLQQAALGDYAREQFQQTRLGLLDEYFTASAQGFTTRKFLREMVQFSCDDLTSPKRMAPAESIYGSFDLILCRNVLIYFDIELQTRVFEKLDRSLTLGGILILGNAETLPRFLMGKFKVLDAAGRIYRKAER